MQVPLLYIACVFPLVLLACGLWLLIKSKLSHVARGAGVFLILAATLLGASLLRGIRIVDLLQPHTAPQTSPHFELRHLGVIRDFLPGEGELSSNRKPGHGNEVPTGVREWVRQNICSVWKNTVSERRNGVVILIGATDRVPLKPHVRKRYESNVGLAQARASNVSALVAQSCNLSSENRIALVAGPRNTPAESPAATADFGEDRSVELWIYWSSDDLAPSPASLPALSLQHIPPDTVQVRPNPVNETGGTSRMDAPRKRSSQLLDGAPRQRSD
jgi:hypothetical protein